MPPFNVVYRQFADQRLGHGFRDTETDLCRLNGAETLDPLVADRLAVGQFLPPVADKPLKDVLAHPLALGDLLHDDDVVDDGRLWQGPVPPTLPRPLVSAMLLPNRRRISSPNSLSRFTSASGTRPSRLMLPLRIRLQPRPTEP